jgi:quercetin dioxygenase-like cupin family protein
MENAQFRKLKPISIIDYLEYVPDAIARKIVIKKNTGTVIVFAFDTGQVLTGNVSPFDTFIQFIDGKAEVIVDEKLYLFETGQCIILPAHCRHTIRASVRFKMLSTVIKSGYEDIGLKAF